MKLLNSLRNALLGEKPLDSQTKPHYRPDQAFDRPSYEEVTRKRLDHLATLQLPVAGKSVIDVGCGIGRLSEFFEKAGSTVFCVDGREENIARLKELYPSRGAAVADVETDTILQHGKFDIVFCYGLLYHVVDVHAVIRRLTQLSKGIVLIETCITPTRENLLRLVREQAQDVTQALGGWGSRPSPSYIDTCLRQSGMPHIYSPKIKPDHEQFDYKLIDGLDAWPITRLKREIFIASFEPLDNPQLSLRD